eukprot:m51a1_g9978 hypothetical protein (1657) ;mRNA; r:92-9317
MPRPGSRQLGRQVGELTREGVAFWLASDAPPLRRWADSHAALWSSIVRANDDRFPAVAEEIRGVADGAGVHNVTDLYLLALSPEISGALADESASGLDHGAGCADVASRVSGQSILAHNEDWEPKYRRWAYLLAINAEYLGGRQIWSLAYPAYPYGFTFGWNSGGVALSCNAQTPRGLVGQRGLLSRYFINRDALDAPSCEEAAERVRGAAESGIAYGFAMSVACMWTDSLTNFEVAGHDISELRVGQEQWMWHVNMYTRLNVAQHLGNTSVHRGRRFQEFAAPRSAADVRAMLGDTQDPVFPIYRDGAAPDQLATIVTSVFDFHAGTVALYNNNSRDFGPVVVIALPPCPGAMDRDGDQGGGPWRIATGALIAVSVVLVVVSPRLEKRLRIQRPGDAGGRPSARDYASDYAQLARPPRHYGARQHRVSPAPFRSGQFTHANFHFVLSRQGASDQGLVYDPERMAEWDEVEEILIFSNDPHDPICLSEPVAGKSAKCGHVFCWPCVLRHASSAAERERVAGCPICGEPFRPADLRSARVQAVPRANPGERVRMTLLRRLNGSIVPLPPSMWHSSAARTARLPRSGDQWAKFSHFSVAADISSIVTRERAELERAAKEAQSEGDDSLPFILASLSSLIERSMKHSEHNGVVSPDSCAQPEADADGAAPSAPQTSAWDESPLPRQRQAQSQAAARRAVLGMDAQQQQAADDGPVALYQQAEGGPVFLHPLGLRMLAEEFGYGDRMPHSFEAEVLESLDVVQDEATRKRYKMAAHLPLSCSFRVVELDMSGVVSPAVLERFAPEIERRRLRRERQEREREESRLLAERTPIMPLRPPNPTDDDFPDFVCGSEPLPTSADFPGTPASSAASPCVGPTTSPEPLQQQRTFAEVAMYNALIRAQEEEEARAAAAAAAAVPEFPELGAPAQQQRKAHKPSKAQKADKAKDKDKQPLKMSFAAAASGAMQSAARTAASRSSDPVETETEAVVAAVGPKTGKHKKEKLSAVLGIPAVPLACRLSRLSSSGTASFVSRLCDLVRSGSLDSALALRRLSEAVSILERPLRSALDGAVVGLVLLQERPHAELKELMRWVELRSSQRNEGPKSWSYSVKISQDTRGLSLVANTPASACGCRLARKFGDERLLKVSIPWGVDIEALSPLHTAGVHIAGCNYQFLLMRSKGDPSEGERVALMFFLVEGPGFGRCGVQEVREWCLNTEINSGLALAKLQPRMELMMSQAAGTVLVDASQMRKYNAECYALRNDKKHEPRQWDMMDNKWQEWCYKLCWDEWTQTKCRVPSAKFKRFCWAVALRQLASIKGKANLRDPRPHTERGVDAASSRSFRSRGLQWTDSKQYQSSLKGISFGMFEGVRYWPSLFVPTFWGSVDTASWKPRLVASYSWAVSSSGEYIKSLIHVPGALKRLLPVSQARANLLNANRVQGKGPERLCSPDLNAVLHSASSLEPLFASCALAGLPPARQWLSQHGDCLTVVTDRHNLLALMMFALSELGLFANKEPADGWGRLVGSLCEDSMTTADANCFAEGGWRGVLEGFLEQQRGRRVRLIVRFEADAQARDELLADSPATAALAACAAWNAESTLRVASGAGAGAPPLEKVVEIKTRTANASDASERTWLASVWAQLLFGGVQTVAVARRDLPKPGEGA